MAKLSFTTMVTPDMTGVEAIQAARRYGYQGVDLRVSEKKGELTVDSTPGEIADLRRAFEGEGILPASLLCYNDVGSREPGSWEKMEVSVLRHVTIAADLGAPAIRIFGGAILEYDSVDAFIDRSAEVVARVFEKEHTGVGIVLQNHGGSYSFMQGVALAKRLDSPRFGLAFSPDHVCVMQEDWDEVLAVAKEFTRQFYVADVAAPEDGEDAPRHRAVLPGKGVIRLKEAYDAIGASAFTGWISLKYEKVWHPEFEDPEVSLPWFIEWFTAEVA